MTSASARTLPVAVSLLLFAALACALTPGAASPPPHTPTVPPVSAAPPTSTAASPAPADTATLAPTALPPTVTVPPQVPQAPLAAEGPWLLLTAPDGYWAMNPDGSGLTHLMAPPPYFQPGPAAPSGGHVAFVGADDPTGARGLKLYTLSLPGGQTQLVTALTGPTTEPPPDAQPGDAAFNLLYPAGQSAWSPDGRRLAFIGLMDGPSADLYVYSLDDALIARLTDGPSQAYQPSWSPDGQFVVQTGADSFGSGAGYVMAGVWAARADNTEVIPLYTPDSGDERLHGWPAADRFLVDSFRPQCSYGDLRQFSLTALSFTPLFPGFYDSVAVDAAQGRAVVAVSDSVSGCANTPAAGFYLAAPDDEPKLLSEGDARQATWVPEAGLFMGRLNEALVAFTADGQPAPLPVELETLPYVAPGGQHWAWTGLESYQLFASLNGETPRLVYDGFIFRAAWSPDGQTLLFDGDGTFYAAYAPDFIPAPIAAGLLDSSYATTLTWIEK